MTSAATNRHRNHPRRQTRLTPEARQTAQHVDKDILHQVRNVNSRRRQRANDTRDPRGVEVNKILQRGPISRSKPGDDVGVVD
jgi:hypothetical protein